MVKLGKRTPEIALRALVGSHNYNLQSETYDRDYKVFVLAKKKNILKSKKYSAEVKNHELHDIRKSPDFFYGALTQI